MPSGEILVIVFGLFLGYWIVAYLLPQKGKAERPAADATNAAAPDDVAAAPWHEVLGVTPDASVDEIDAAYRSLAGDAPPGPPATPGDEPGSPAGCRAGALARAHAEGMAARRGAA